jgi:hypothetical protein
MLWLVVLVRLGLGAERLLEAMMKSGVLYVRRVSKSLVANVVEIVQLVGEIGEAVVVVVVVAVDVV